MNTTASENGVTSAKVKPDGRMAIVWRRGTLAILTVLVVFSALAVVFSAYQHRKHFNAYQELADQRDDLQVQWGQLLLEQSALAAHSRIEDIVTQRLGMYVPQPSEIVVVRP